MSLKKHRIVRFVVVITVAVGWSSMSARGAEVSSARGGVDLLGTLVDGSTDAGATTQAGGIAACCLPDGSCSVLTEADCLYSGGNHLPGTPDCSGGVCDLGSCCYDPPDFSLGSCDDGFGEGIPIEQCDTAGDGTYFGGALCADEPCRLCEIDEPGFCQTHNGNFIFLNDSEVPNTRWADDYRPQTSGIADEWCWEVCFYNPTLQIECFYDPPADGYSMTIYADGGGFPADTEIQPPLFDGPVTTIARTPEDIQTSRCWQYSFNVPDAPLLDAGECYFVQLTGTGDVQGCNTYIQGSADGNSYALHDTNNSWGFEDIVQSFAAPPDPDIDLAFCSNLGVDVENGGCGDWIGACCLPPFGARCSVTNTIECPNGDGDCPDGETCETCLDNVAHGDCDALGGLPNPVATCAEEPCPQDCEQDDCITGEVPNLNDADDPGDCDAGLLDELGNSTPCTRPFSNVFCDPTVIETACEFEEPLGSDTWMSYTMSTNECGILTVSTCVNDGGSFSANGILAAYVVGDGSGCPADIVNPTVCDNDACGFWGSPATVSVPVTQFETVYIRAGGWQGAQGAGVMVLSLDPVMCVERAQRPNPDPEIGLGTMANSTVQPCNTAAECSEAGFGVPPNVDCISQPNGLFPGTCYVSASRYLSISPNADNAGGTARRITLDINDNDTYDPGVDHVLGWVDQPVATLVAGTEPSPQAQARISAVSIYRNWNDLTDVDSSFIGAVSVKVGDCEITAKGSAAQGAVSGNVYFIQAISQGAPEGDESSYSVPLRLRTTARHGDQVGTGLGGNYPNQGVSMLDVFADVLGFMGAQQIPKWRLEMTGSSGLPGQDNFPDFGNINMGDIFNVVIAFQTGGEYPFSQPCDCDGQNCP